MLEQTLTIEIAVAFHPLIPLLVLYYALADWTLGFIHVVQLQNTTTYCYTTTTTTTLRLPCLEEYNIHGL